MSRPAPTLVLICPPATHDPTVIIYEDGQRQTWTRVQLASDQLDYWNLAPLAAGWACWHHEGRYLSDHTVQVLNWYKMPEPPFQD